MVRLIDADELSCKIKEASKEAGFYRPIYEGFLNSINRSPTIEAEPVRHGEWIDGEWYMDEDGFHHQVYCSLCGRYEDEKELYCNCGAKMDGGDNNGQAD